MSPEHEESSSGEDVPDSPKSPQEEGASAETSTKPPAKKRTKTGCLTCRKRRIKCGEERPVCKNCVKSKRECAGYAPPPGYKQDHMPGPDFEGVAMYPPHSYYLAQSQPLYDPEYQNPQLGFFNAPPDVGDPTSPLYGSLPQYSSTFGYVFPDPQQQQHLQQATAFPPPDPTWDMSVPSVSQQAIFNARTFPMQISPAYNLPPHQNGSSASESATLFGYAAVPPLLQTHLSRESNWSEQSAVLTSAHTDATASNLRLPHSMQQAAPSGMSSFPITMPTLHTGRPSPNFNLEAPVHLSEPRGQGVSADHFQPGRLQHSATPPQSSLSKSSTLVTDADDMDQLDEKMDDEIESALTMSDAKTTMEDMLSQYGSQATNSPVNPFETRRRQSNRIGTRPILSPFHDEKNKLIFCNFVEGLGQYMSMFERTLTTSPADAVWCSRIAPMAMLHPALAYSILLVSAQQLSRVHRAPSDVIEKYWGRAVSLVGKLVGQPNKRTELATLAAVLLLGYYEVLVGDHARWILHMAGATKLIQEYDYAKMTRTIRRARSEAKLRIKQATENSTLTHENYGATAGIPAALLDDSDWDVDGQKVAQFTGFAIDYDNDIQPSVARKETVLQLTDDIVDDYKARMDLTWWYRKQDVIQGLISGDPLLLPFEQWKYCPPRGVFGKSDKPNATFDHLALLMARLLDFGGKDRVRKLRVMATQGGKWIPPPGLFGPPADIPGGNAGAPPDELSGVSSENNQSPTSANRPDSMGGTPPTGKPTGAAGMQAPIANEGRPRQSKTSVKDTVPMFGMVPPPSGPVHMPSSFYAMSAKIHDEAFGKPIEEKRPSMSQTLDEQTEQALADHAKILAAFESFAQLLGTDFQPLPTDESLYGPFGPVIRYRHSAIAILWSLYYTGMIMVRRLHPHMPAAATMAAGVAAMQTVDYAQKIGKICSGLNMIDRGSALNWTAYTPLEASAMLEATLPLMFAGMLYMDPGQRAWTVQTIMRADTDSGFKTAAYMASACEMVWIIMGEQGQGPPYRKTLFIIGDERLNGDWYATETYKDSAPAPSDVLGEHESKYVHHDRHQIGVFSSTRVHWALGVLALEEDMQKLSMGSP